MTQELIERLEPCPFCGDPLEYSAKHETWGHSEMASGCIASAILIFDGDDAAFWNTRDQSQSARIAERDRVIGIAADALDVADNIIAVNMGTDTPKEWDRAFKRVAKARASLTKDSTSGR